MLDPEKVDFKQLGFRAGLEVYHQIDRCLHQAHLGLRDTGNVEEVKKLMQTSIAGEMTARGGPRGFMLLQGIEPGIDKILKRL
jgi:hypothetical protein